MPTSKRPERSSPIPRPRGLSDNLRTRVFDASMAVFAEHGFEAARMEQVAETAGVARGTLYYHFRTKADLFHFVLHHGMDLHARYVRERIERASDPRERLDALIDSYVDFYVEYASFTRVAIAETARLSTNHDVGPTSVLGDLVVVTAGVLAEARQAGLLKDLDPDICLSAFLGLVSSVPMFYASFHQHLPTDDLKSALAAIFLTGVLAD